MNTRATIVWFNKYDIEYRINIDGEHETTGSFTHNDLPQPYEQITGEKSFIIPKNSSLEHVRFVWKIFENALYATGTKNWYVFNDDAVIKYRGKENGKRLFLIIYPYFSNNSKNMESHQTLLFVDELSKEVVSAQSDIIFKNGDKISLSASYQLCGKGQMEMLYPDKITGTIHQKVDGKEQIINADVKVVSAGRYKTIRIPRSKIPNANKQ